MCLGQSVHPVQHVPHSASAPLRLVPAAPGLSFGAPAPNGAQRGRSPHTPQPETRLQSAMMKARARDARHKPGAGANREAG